MPKIYLAGSSYDPEPVKKLRESLLAEGHTVHAAWLDLNPEHLPPEEVIWTTCIKQIQISEILIVVVPLQYHLRGAIFEAGYAAALRIPRIIFDQYGEFEGTWDNTPRSYKASSVKEIIETLRAL